MSLVAGKGLEAEDAPRPSLAGRPLPTADWRLKLRNVVRYWTRAAAYRILPTAAIRRLQARFPGALDQGSAAHWDQLHAGVCHHYLGGNLGVDTRNELSMWLLRQTVAPSSVLDVACAGAGLLTVPAAAGLKRYVGLDLSRYAIDHAVAATASLRHARMCDITLAVGDLRCYTPPEGERFDAIVFNEILYYLDPAEAVQQARRYARWLSPPGALCVSCKHDPKSQLILRKLRRHFSWVCGTLYQQRLDGPGYRIRKATDATVHPAFLIGILRPKRT